MGSLIEGGCLCGACRYATDAAAINVRACHCRRCQKATGAPFYARVMVPVEGLKLSGPVGWYDAGTGVRRGFCKQCGTSLFSERPEAGTIGLTMGSLDKPDQFRPADHIWYSARQKWICLDDELPKFPEGPPA